MEPVEKRRYFGETVYRYICPICHWDWWNNSWTVTKCPRCKEPLGDDGTFGISPTTISERIAKLRKEKEQLWKDYCDKNAEIDMQIERLQKEISNEAVLHNKKEPEPVTADETFKFGWIRTGGKNNA